MTQSEGKHVAQVVVSHSPLLSELSQVQRDQAMQRFEMLHPFLEGEQTLVQVAQLHAIPLRTARRWVARYRQAGLVGLAPKSRTDQGSHPSLGEWMQSLIEGLALKRPPLSVAIIHRQVVTIATERGEHPPSYGTVYAVIKQIDPGLLTLAHEGRKVYQETFDLLHRREAESPNAIWQADHTLLDLWVRNDKGKAARPWLTVIIDDYSRAVAGYFLSFAAPSALQTALALHQAIWRKANPLWHVCGIPAMLYTDHGSDFISQHLEQVCADLKIRLVFSQAGQPRGRGRIERFFETINQMLLPCLAGYAPRGSPLPQPDLTLPQFNRAFEQFIQQYHTKPHSATGIAPQARWDANGFLPQMPQSLQELDLLLLTVVKARRVHQDGIRFQGLRYLDLTLSAYVGEYVTIRYDPRDMAEVRVYHSDQFLCRAICPELASTTISLKEIVTARNRRRQDLKKQLSERTAFVDALTHPAPQEAGPRELPLSPPVPQTSLSSLKRYANDD